MSYVTSLQIFIRVYELGNMSAAARDRRVSPAVASSRMSELEKQLGVRLFNRTTRSLQPTAHGTVFYEGAKRILAAIDEAEAAVADIAKNPRGTIYISAPLGVGKRLIGPNVPAFHKEYPSVRVRMRMSDRKIDLTSEGLDIAFILGPLVDSNLRVRTIAECPRVLCASPEYVKRRGMPETGADLVTEKHDCLMLRFPGAEEINWILQTPDGPQKYDVTGPFESDDGDVLTEWALEGNGVINKAMFDVADHLKSGALIPVAEQNPPVPIFLACLYPHKRLQDPKVRLFIDFMVKQCKQALSQE